MSYKQWLNCLAAIASIAFGLMADPIEAGVGELDDSFGTGGQVLITFDLGTGDLPSHSDQAHAVMVQPDGGTLVGGVVTRDSDGEDQQDFAIVRLMPDGSPDTDFGSGGRVLVGFDLGGSTDFLSTIAPYPGDRIVAAGTAETMDGTGGVGDWAVVRLTDAGVLDTSFNLDGRVNLTITPVSESSGAYLRDMAVQPDGKIILVGVSAESKTDSRATVARLNVDGSLDTTFGDAGIARFEIGGGGLIFATGVAMRATGEIVVAGTAGPEMFALQLLPGGGLDTSFGDDGVRLVSFDQGGGSGAASLGVSLDPQGRIVLGGFAVNTADNADFAAARLLADGTPDPAFGSDGRVQVGFDIGGDRNDRANAVDTDAAGRVYLAGEISTAADNGDVGVLRLTDSGQPDPGFGAAGKFTHAVDHDPPVFDSDFGRGLAVDQLERVVIAGAAYLGPTGNYDMLVLRLTGEMLFSDRFETSP